MSFDVARPVHCLLASLLVAAAGAQHEQTSLRIEREIVLRGGSSHCLAWSRDGKRIASGGDCGDVLVVDADTGRVVHELLAADHWIGALLFSPDGGTLFVGGRDLTRWDLGSGKQTAQAALAYPSSVALTHDGARVASVSDNSTVELRDARHLELERTLTVPDESAIDAVAFDRQATRLAVGKRSGRTYVFGVASGEIVEKFRQRDWVSSLAYRDDNRLARLGSDGMLFGFTDRDELLGQRAWGMSFDDAARAGVTWGGEHVNGFTRDGPAFVVPGPGPAAVHAGGSSWVRARDGKLELHRGDELVRTLPLAHRARPGDVVFVGDGKHLAVGTHVFDVANGAAVPIPEGVLRGQPIDYPGGPELAMWQRPRWFEKGDGTLSLWSIGALRAGERRPVREHRIPFSGLVEVDTSPVFTGDGRFFGVSDAVRDTLQPEQASWSVPPDFLRTLRPLPGGRSAWAVTVSDGGYWHGRLTLQLLAADGKNGPVREYWGCYAIDWLPDCSRLLLGQHDGAHVLDTDSGTSLGFLRGTRSDCKWIANDTLLSLRYGGLLELIATPACTVTATLDLPCTWGRIAKAADGRRAAIATHDRVIVVRIGGG